MTRVSMSNSKAQTVELFRRFRCVLKFIKVTSFESLEKKHKSALGSVDEGTRTSLKTTWNNLKVSSKIVGDNFAKIDVNDRFEVCIIENLIKSAISLKFVEFEESNTGEDVSVDLGALDKELSNLSIYIGQLSVPLSRK